MQPIIFNIFGYKRSGKDTLAQFLIDENIAAKLSFAEPLRDIVSTAFPYMTKEFLQGEDKEKPVESLPLPDKVKELYPQLFEGINHWTPRKLLQFLGTEVFRDLISDDVWVNNAKFKLLTSYSQNFVITDCRFPNEFKMLHSVDIISKYIVVDIKVVRDSVSASDIHVSEKFISTFHPTLIINNNKSLPELKTNFKKTLELAGALYGYVF